MSRIQEAFNALGRELLESEKPAVAAFKAKYAGTAKAGTQVESAPEPAAARGQRKALKRVVLREVRSTGGGRMYAVVNDPNGQFVGTRPGRVEPEIYRDAQSGKALSRRERGLLKDLTAWGKPRVRA